MLKFSEIVGHEQIKDHCRRQSEKASRFTHIFFRERPV